MVEETVACLSPLIVCTRPLDVRRATNEISPRGHTQIQVKAACGGRFRPIWTALICREDLMTNECRERDQSAWVGACQPDMTLIAPQS
jgi:hypothetical protein